jgi:acyl-CoA thioester hydrolase
MSRIEFEEPEHYSFSTQLAVRITDINYGNHLGHDAVMSVFHEARVRMLQSKGFSEIDIGGCGIIMADTGIIFKNEVFYPATLQCDLAICNLSRTSFEVYYRLSRLEDNALIARAKTGMVCFDYQQKKVARMPDAFRQAFAAPV